jgi:RNA-directed DNA polymerase
VSQKWLIRFLEHRIGDKRIIRLVQKWLKAGVLEDGVVSVRERGTGQGAVISPLLANIYLRYFGLASPLGEKRSPQDRSKAVRVA